MVSWGKQRVFSLIQLRRAGAVTYGTLLLFTATYALQKPFRVYPGFEYTNFPLPKDYQEKTEWAFARLMYPPVSPRYGGAEFLGSWKQGQSNWTMDYPRSDRHLSQAVRRLTFESASTFGLNDRGLLHPGKVADIVIFDPDTVKPLPLEVVHDFPTGAKRIKEPAQGIYATFVAGEMLMQEGEHTGALPGRVLRNSYYKANHA